MNTIILIAIIIVVLMLLFGNKKEKDDFLEKMDDTLVEVSKDLEDENGILNKEEIVLTPKQKKLYDLQVKLERAGFPINPKEFIRIKTFSTIFIFVVTYLFSKNIALGALFAFAWTFVPNLALKMAENKKKRQFEEQIEGSLTLIRNSLAAGMSFQYCLEVVAEEMDPPISKEFALVLHELNLGKDFSVALYNMLDRVRSDEMKLVVVAVLIQREVGGSLADVIDVILETIKDRIQIKGEIRTLTAQGKLSAIVISLLPIILGLIMYVMNPEYMKPMFIEPLGQMLLGICLVLMCIGVFIISKIVNIDF